MLKTTIFKDKGACFRRNASAANNSRMAGFALPMTIFMVVTVSAMVVAMAKFGTTQSASVDLLLLKMQNDLAARSGAEWVSHQVFSTKACPGTVPVITGFTLSITRCEKSTFREAAMLLDRFDITLESVTAGRSRTDQDHASSRLELTFVVNQ